MSMAAMSSMKRFMTARTFRGSTKRVAQQICGELARHLGYVLEIRHDEKLAHVLLAEWLVEVHLGAETDVRTDERRLTRTFLICSLINLAVVS